MIGGVESTSSAEQNPLVLFCVLASFRTSEGSANGNNGANIKTVRINNTYRFMSRGIDLANQSLRLNFTLLSIFHQNEFEITR